MKKIKLLSLFSGIGAFEKALQRLKLPYELIGFSEIDKYATTAYSAIHNINKSLNLGDVREISIESLPQNIDMITHGSPCQSFSIVGKGEGGNRGSNTKSSLMWYTVNIVKHIKPKYVIWENVKGILSKKHRHNFDLYLNTLKSYGYNNYYKVLNAKNYGIPQDRERVFVVSIRNDIDIYNFDFPKKLSIEAKLNDFLIDNVKQKYYKKNTFNSYLKYNGIDFSENTLLKLFNNKERVSFRNDGICYTLTASGRNCGNNLYIVDKGRVLTPLECWRLMGFDDKDYWIARKALEKTYYNGRDRSNTRMYKMAGNSIVVNVLEEIFRNLFLK